MFGNLKDLKPLLGLLENAKQLSLADLFHSFWESDIRKAINLDKAIWLIREKTTLPPVLGIPLSISSSGNALVSLHSRLKTARQFGRHGMRNNFDVALTAG
jgi:hypothetical protein